MTLIFSSEARTLMGILGEAAQRTRARLDADRAAGRAVATCLPPKGKATINAMELVAYLRSLSPADRAKSFDAGASYIAPMATVAARNKAAAMKAKVISANVRMIALNRPSS